MEMHRWPVRRLFISYYHPYLIRSYSMKLNPRRIETIIVFLIALHSLVVGLAMVFQPIRTLELFGWNYQGPMFFPTQAGVFLVLFGILFMAILFHRTLTWFIVVVKTAAVIFLLSQHFILAPNAPDTILLAALLDGLMGASVAAVLIWQKASEN